MANERAGGAKSRLDRELDELLQELRVLLPGVQVLFAFLLTLPFSTGFPDTTDAERAVYFAAFAATALSALLLMVPSVRHRWQFRRRDKEEILQSANRLTLVATGLLAVAIACVGFLIGDVVYGGVVGGISAGVVLVVVAWFWYGWVVLRRETDGR